MKRVPPYNFGEQKNDFHEKVFVFKKSLQWNTIFNKKYSCSSPRHIEFGPQNFIQGFIKWNIWYIQSTWYELINVHENVHMDFQLNSLFHYCPILFTYLLYTCLFTIHWLQQQYPYKFNTYECILCKLDWFSNWPIFDKHLS